MLYSSLVTQDVVVSELDSVVDLGLPEPRLFVPGGEDLHSHTLTHPGAPPHLSVPPLTWLEQQHIHNNTIISFFPYCVYLTTCMQRLGGYKSYLKKAHRLTDTLCQRDLSGHGPLDQIGQTGATSWGTELIKEFLQRSINITDALVRKIWLNVASYYIELCNKCQM